MCIDLTLKKNVQTKKYIQDLPNLEWVPSCKDAFEVLEFLQKETFDVFFRY